MLLLDRAAFHSSGFHGWPHRPHQRVNASRWPLIGALGQVWNFRLHRSCRPAGVYRCEVLEWPSTGADGEGEISHPAHPGSCHPSIPRPKPSTRCHGITRSKPQTRTGSHNFAGGLCVALHSRAWAGCRRGSVRARREHRFDTSFEPKTTRACSARSDRSSHMCRWCMLETLRSRRHA